MLPIEKRGRSTCCYWKWMMEEKNIEPSPSTSWWVRLLRNFLVGNAVLLLSVPISMDVLYDMSRYLSTNNMSSSFLYSSSQRAIVNVLPSSSSPKSSARSCQRLRTDKEGDWHLHFNTWKGIKFPIAFCVELIGCRSVSPPPFPHKHTAALTYSNRRSRPSKMPRPVPRRVAQPLKMEWLYFFSFFFLN